MKICAYCDGEVEDAKEVCPSCGSSKFKFRCGKCGAVFIGKFCPECGEKAEVPSNPVSVEKEPLRKGPGSFVPAENSSGSGKKVKTASVKKPIYKKVWFWLLALLLLAGLGSGGAEDAVPEKGAGAAPVSVNTAAPQKETAAMAPTAEPADDTTPKTASVEEIAPAEEASSESSGSWLDLLFGEAEDDSAEPKEYTHATVSQMVSDLEGNAMNASDLYNGKYLEITGRLSNIDSSGKYITLDPADDLFCLTGVQCYIRNSEQKSQVVSMKDGDMVTLRGKCTDVSELFGYTLNIDSIDGYAAAEVSVTSSAEAPVICSAAQLVSDLETNALKAEMTYKGQYLQLSGQVSGFDSDGKYFSLDPVNSYFNLTSITIYLKNDDVRSAARQLSKGDIITVTGKCTDVGELLGYSVNADAIVR